MTAEHDTPAPAPWELKARGYIFVLRLKDPAASLPDELRAHRLDGGFSYAMFVDYAESPVGPYHELLFIPGAFRFGDHRGYTITKIYVSSNTSVLNGRRNWGIPKELATFEVDYGKDNIDRIQMSVNGQLAADLTLKHYPLPVPLLGSVVPSGMRTLLQPYEGNLYRFAPTATGMLTAAKLKGAVVDPTLFPAFTPDDMTIVVRVASMSMTFPVATLE